MTLSVCLSPHLKSNGSIGNRARTMVDVFSCFELGTSCTGKGLQKVLANVMVVKWLTVPRRLYCLSTAEHAESCKMSREISPSTFCSGILSPVSDALHACVPSIYGIFFTATLLKSRRLFSQMWDINERRTKHSGPFWQWLATVGSALA